MVKERKFVKVFKTAKVVQLVSLFLIEGVYFFILLSKPSVFKRITDDNSLYVLFIITWAMLLFNLFFMLYDFYNLKLFAIETEALNKAAYMDTLTGIMNRHGLDTMYQKNNTPESVANIGCAMITITNLLEINSLFGHARGDKLISDFGAILSKKGSSYGTVSRNSANDFVIVIDSCKKATLDAFFNELTSELAEYNKTYKEAPIEINHSTVINADEHLESFTAILSAAYKKLHF